MRGLRQDRCEMKFSGENHGSTGELCARFATTASSNYRLSANSSEVCYVKPFIRSQRRNQLKQTEPLKFLPLILMSVVLINLQCVISQNARPDKQNGAINKQETSVNSTAPLPSTTGDSNKSIKNGSSQVPSESTSVAYHEESTASSRPMNGAQIKTKPSNSTLVDEIFDAVLSEGEVVKKWKSMDSQLQSGVRTVLKMVFPQIVALSQEAKVSGDCSGGILKWILSLRNLRSWAIQMLDATGKPTAGMLQGSLSMFGNYRQCLNIRAPDEDEIELNEKFEEYFRGQYCIIHLKPWMPIKRPFYHLNSTIESLVRKNYKYYEKTLYDDLAEIAVAFNFIDIRLDLCIPSTCTVADIQRFTDLLSKKVEMRSKVIRCDIAAREGVTLLSQIDRTTYYWVAVPLIMLTISLLATILHCICSVISRMFRNREEQNQSRDSKAATSNLLVIVESLSFVGASKNRIKSPVSNHCRCNNLVAYYLDSETGSSDQASSGSCSNEELPAGTLKRPVTLYGVRNVFIIWFFVIQMTVEFNYQYLRESITLKNMIISNWPFQIIVNSVLLFDSLILITAFTFGYTCISFSLKELISYIVDKYVRMMLPIISLIALTIVTPLISIYSPVWHDFVDQQSMVCKSTGYINLFFLQNFIPYDKICLPHTWLFCVEFQLIVLSLPLILLLKRNFLSTKYAITTQHDNPVVKEKSSLMYIVFMHLLRSRAGFSGLLLGLAGLAVNFFMVYTKQLPPSWFNTFPDIAQKNFYYSQYLTKTWTHLSVFIIGLLAGHLCRSTLQLRSADLSRNGQLSQKRHIQQSSPSPSGSDTLGHNKPPSRHSVHGSTSTIIPSETGNRLKREPSDFIHTSQTRSSNYPLMRSISIHLVSLICMAAIIFSTFSWSTKEGPTILMGAAYDALSRLIWSLALVVIMTHLCLTEAESNRYSSFARFFAHPLCTLMGRLSFLTYLLSPYIHTFILAVQEQSLFPSLYLLFHVIVGNIVITYALAFLAAIVIEQPARRLLNQIILCDRDRLQGIDITHRCDVFAATLSQQKQV